MTSGQRGLRSFPRTIASWTAPATIAACAQTACASRCIVENVENDRDDPEQRRRRARRATARGTRARRGGGTPRSRRSPRRASRRPRRSTAAPASQCAISALGTTPSRSRSSARPGRDQEHEHEPDERDEQRRLHEEVVGALSLAVQEDDPVGLGDRPDEPAEDRQRAESCTASAARRCAARPASRARLPSGCWSRTRSSPVPPARRVLPSGESLRNPVPICRRARFFGSACA